MNALQLTEWEVCVWYRWHMGLTLLYLSFCPCLFSQTFKLYFFNFSLGNRLSNHHTSERQGLRHKQYWLYNESEPNILADEATWAFLFFYKKTAVYAQLSLRQFSTSVRITFFSARGIFQHSGRHFDTHSHAWRYMFHFLRHIIAIHIHSATHTIPKFRVTRFCFPHFLYFWDILLFVGQVDNNSNNIAASGKFNSLFLLTLSSIFRRLDI